MLEFTMIFFEILVVYVYKGGKTSTQFS